VQHPEIHHHRIEAGIGERQRLRVPFTKCDLRIPASRLVDHGAREIDARDADATLGGRGGDEPRTAGDVEHHGATRGADGVEQGWRRLDGQWTEGVGVERGGTFPAGVLEIVKGSGA
jgi:hypothetical protein